VSGEVLFAERGIWIGTSLIFALIAAWSAWLIGQRVPQVQALVARWEELPETPWIYHTLRLVYAIGLPAAALLVTGSLTERGLGLQPLLLFDSAAPLETVQANWADWAGDFGWLLLFLSVAGFLLWIARRSTGLPQGDRDPGIALREACYHQAHWAFYREPFVLLWGPAMGAWGGLALVVAEALLNPIHWITLQHPGRSRNLLFRAALAVLSMIFFIQTQNFWMALLLDTGLGWFWGQE